MTDSAYTQEDVAYIRTHVERLERMVAFEISANPRSTEKAREALESRPGMAEVYLALESGPKTQTELTQSLRMSQPVVSRVCKELVQAGFIEPMRVEGRGTTVVYRWTEFEQLLKLARTVRAIVQEKAKTSNAKRAATPPADVGDLEVGSEGNFLSTIATEIGPTISDKPPADLDRDESETKSHVEGSA